MNNITVNKDWMDKAHLELLNNAANSLAEMGVISEAEIENIKDAIKGQEDGEIPVD